MEHVRVESDDGVAVVTLVDVDRRNAMTGLMVDEIVATFDALESDGSTAAVVVTGEPPAFCSGADVSSLGALSRAGTDEEGALLLAVSLLYSRYRTSIEKLWKRDAPAGP